MYRSLSTKRREIRLLRILSGEEESTLVSCELSSFSLLDNPIFNALSYMWGDPTITAPILVNGQPFHATVNLAAALEVFRTKGMQDLLWVDAICINQLSIEDKNQQLPLMRDIYVKARKTLVWLGLGGSPRESESPAFRLTRSWAATMKEAHVLVRRNELDIQDPKAFGLRNFKRTRSPSNITAKRCCTNHKTVEAFLGHRLDDAIEFSEYTALEQVLQHSYWDRIWITQEFVLAQDIALFIGLDECQFDLFNYSYRKIKTFHHYNLTDTLSKPHLASLNLGSSTLDALVHLKSKYIEGTRLLLWEMLNLNVRRESSNPLDAVYGFLGMVETPDFPILVDYSMSPSKLFTNLTIDFIRSSTVGLNVLGLVGTAQRKSSIANKSLPSWVPDFGKRAGITVSILDFVMQTEWKVNADAQATASKLEVNGIVCCQIQKACAWSESIYGSLIEMLDLILSIPTPFFCKTPRLQQFFRTLFHDNSGFGLGKTGFRSEARENLFLQEAARFIGLFPDIINFMIQQERRLHGGDLEQLLNNNLDSTDREKLFSQLLLPSELQALAVYLALSPMKLREFTLESLTEQFCGPRGSSSSLSWLNIEGRLERSRFESKLWYYLCGSHIRKDTFFITSGGYMGFGPRGMMAEDEICCIPGCDFPLAIRREVRTEENVQPVEESNKYLILGVCYVYGMMNREMAADPNLKQKLRPLVFI